LGGGMPRYYFDIHDDDLFTPDDEGVDLDGVEAARDEAARTLGEIARDVLPGSLRRVLKVEVRDEDREPLLEARLVFEVARLR
jgi:hypothetical protein